MLAKLDWDKGPYLTLPPGRMPARQTPSAEAKYGLKNHFRLWKLKYIKLKINC